MRTIPIPVVCALAVSVCGLPVRGQSLLSFKAVEHNGESIPPTNRLEVVEGDEVVVELFYSGWGSENPAELLRGYQVTLNDEGFLDGCGASDSVRPVAWLYPRPTVSCETDADCCEPNGFCTTGGFHRCVGSLDPPQFGAFVDTARDDWVFANAFSSPSGFVAVDSPRYSFAGFTFLGETADLGAEAYLGTLVLEVIDRCVEAEVAPIDSPATDFLNEARDEIPYQWDGLELVGVDAGCDLTACDLPQDRCVIDARMPHRPLAPGRIQEWRFQIGVPVGAGCGPIEFGVGGTETCSGRLGGVQEVLSSEDGAVVSVVLEEPIQVGEWTCLHVLESRACGFPVLCAASLPGDVNGDRVVGAPDIVHLIDGLNGLFDPPLPLTSCDINDDGVCGAPDITMLIDLMNGASAFEPYLGRRLAAPCPLD